MDYTTVPRSLIYRERRSFEEFGIYEEDSIMRPLSDAIFDFDFIRAPNAEERARWCMNNAFYICTMFFLERDPKWRYDQYKRIATPEKNGFPWRASKAVNSRNVSADGQWHLISVPLKKLTDMGGWSNAEGWKNGQGKFDWTCISYLVFQNGEKATKQGFCIKDVKIVR